MAPVQWMNLPPDILSTLAEILNSDVDLLRLRSVCSSWRSSLPPRQSPISFPLKVSPLLSHPKSRDTPSYFRHEYPILPTGGQFRLIYSTLYRLSPPEHADSSQGWLFRVSEVKPNTFSLLSPLLPAKIESRRIPDQLNLLDYRISEICKCYGLDFVDDKGLVTSLAGVIRKVIVLPNYVVGCDFVLLVLVSNRDMRYCKFGDGSKKDWIPIDVKGYDFDDAILFNGKCYAVCAAGVLVSFDSEFNLTVVYESNYDLVSNYNNFVVYKSDLYVVSKIYDREPDECSSDFEGRYSSPGSPPGWSDDYDDEEEEEEYAGTANYIRTGEDVSQVVCRHSHSHSHSHSDKDEDEDEDVDDDDEDDEDDEEDDDDDDNDDDYEHDDDEEEVTPGYINIGKDESTGKRIRMNKVGCRDEDEGAAEIPLRSKVFMMRDGCCWQYKQLEDDDIFLSSDDVSVGVSAKDFGDCKGNCVYMAHRRFFSDDKGIESGDHHAVYDFDKRRLRSLILETARSRAKIYWPPPYWVYHGCTSSSN